MDGKNCGVKTALLHYWLTNRRGGENVFREICSLFPDGDIFTHSYNPAVMDAWFGERRVVQSGRLPCPSLCIRARMFSQRISLCALHQLISCSLDLNRYAGSNAGSAKIVE